VLVVGSFWLAGWRGKELKNSKTALLQKQKTKEK